MERRGEWRTFQCARCGIEVTTDREADEDAPDLCAACDDGGHGETEWDL